MHVDCGDRETTYWENMVHDCAKKMGHVSTELNAYLKTDIQFQSQIDTYMNKRDLLCGMWEKAQKTLKDIKISNASYKQLHGK